VAAAQRREEEEIEEALRLVEEAMRREEREAEEAAWALRAVALAEGRDAPPGGGGAAGPPGPPGMHAPGMHAPGLHDTSLGLDPSEGGAGGYAVPQGVPIYTDGADPFPSDPFPGGSPPPHAHQSLHLHHTAPHQHHTAPHQLHQPHQPHQPHQLPMDPEGQLAALMELGYHAEEALPFCDGVASIEELVERLSLASDMDGGAYDAYGDAASLGMMMGGDGDDPRGGGGGAGGAQGRRPVRRWQGVARRFMGLGTRQANA
jgi:hypothetical protein